MLDTQIKGSYKEYVSQMWLEVIIFLERLDSVKENFNGGKLNAKVKTSFG